MKDYNGVEKGLLRQAMKGLLPAQILWRKKSPYPKTHDPEYLNLVAARLKDILNNPGSALHALADPNALRDILERDDPWPWYGQLMGRPQTIAYFLQVNRWLEAWNVDIQI